LAAEVWAVDQEPEFIEFGRRKAQGLGVENIRWVAASAETVSLDGDFVLVAIGNAFHRFDRAAVATHVARHIIRGGCIALVWSWSPSQGERPWQCCLAEAIEHWTDRVDARGRVPDNWKCSIDDDPHEAVLGRAGFEWEGRREFPTIERWTVESLIGHVYSSSVLNRAVLGPLTGEFENDIRARLLGCDPTGLFEHDQTYACDLARHPG
jgi:SAM-dependent methyltransferase